MQKQDFSIAIGKRIVKLRTQKGLSQRQLAFACNKDPQSIERVENGKSTPTVFYLKEVCDALEVSLSDFFKDMP